MYCVHCAAWAVVLCTVQYLVGGGHDNIRVLSGLVPMGPYYLWNYGAEGAVTALSANASGPTAGMMEQQPPDLSGPLTIHDRLKASRVPEPRRTGIASFTVLFCFRYHGTQPARGITQGPWAADV